jgi:ABC-2 type transport system ATP-binding protein
MSEPAIELSDISKSFRSGVGRSRVEAVRKLSLSVAPGSVLAFIGPNGAGKTTTLFMLLGFLKPDRGQIKVLGREPGLAEVRARIGFMSEVFRTHPFDTGRAALRFYARLSGLGLDEARSRADAMLAKLGLLSAADRKVGTYSKGMIQRLGLAQALVHQPQLLILDEPTTGLDPEGRRLVADIIREERSRGTTVLLSSHILSDVERSCDQVIMIRNGEAAFAGTMDTIAGSNDWKVEVTGLDEVLTARLTGAGFRIEEGERGVCRVICSSETKRDLLRTLIDMPVEIGRVDRTQGLEDAYMRYLNEPSVN